MTQPTAGQLRATTTTPIAAPAYRAGRHQFVDREYFNVVYRTDPEAFRAAVPEPLTVTDPLVRFEVMHMGDVDGFGPYTECGLVLSVSLDGVQGEFLHSMYLDDFAATASGREVAAYPKAPGAPALAIEHGALLGTFDVGSIRVATATMAYKDCPLDPGDAARIIGRPTWSVKTIRGYDGQPLVLDLAQTQITDLTVKWAYEGPARLHLVDHVLAPMADLPVRQVVRASHIMTDLRLAPWSRAYDYLRGETR